MRKKVLLLTTIYPAPDLNLLNNTNVCHYYAKEWIKQGYEVKVIFNYPIYSPLFHWIASVAEKKTASLGSAYITTKRITQISEYELDGVKVCRMPIYKFMPRIRVSNKNINKQIRDIVESNKKDGFVPDIITAHFYYPHLEMISELSNLYKSKNCIVVHDQGMDLHKIYGESLQHLLDSIKNWGFRSIAIKKNFENKYNIKGNSFMCYSGIPAEYIVARENNIDTNKTLRYVYVGSFIRRKHALETAQALCESKNKNWHIDFIGDGEMLPKVKQYIKTKGKEANVTYWGHQKREKTQAILAKCDCFIMISSRETFGLVYLEAMAKGLITIASKNEGMDGIIIDGVNGFLCNAGDPKALSLLIDKINSYSSDELNYISKNAQETAKKFTEQGIAKNYIESVT